MATKKKVVEPKTVKAPVKAEEPRAEIIHCANCGAENEKFAQTCVKCGYTRLQTDRMGGY